MSEAQKTIQPQSGGIIMPLLKVLLVVAAWAGISYSFVMIDLPNIGSSIGGIFGSS